MRTRAQMKADAKLQLIGNRGKTIAVFLLTILIGLIPTIFSFFVGNGIAYGIINIIISIYTSLLSIGTFIFYLAIRRNEESSVKMLFSGTEYYLKGFGIFILQSLICLVGIILFVIPGIIFGLMYSQALYIYIQNPEMGIIECLKTSRLAMKGHKLDLVVLSLSFIGWILLSGLTLGILLLYVSPYMQLTLVNFYTDLMEDYNMNK